MDTLVFKPLRALCAATIVAAPLAGQAQGGLPAGELIDSDWQRMQVLATPVSQATPLPLIIAEVADTPAAGPSFETRAAIRRQFRQARAEGRLAKQGEIADDDAVLQARDEHVAAQTEEIRSEHRTVNDTLLAQWNVRDATMLVAEGYVSPEPGQGGVAQAEDVPPVWMRPEDEVAKESQAS